jgi:WXG100 family type VII secretion target
MTIRADFDALVTETTRLDAVAENLDARVAAVRARVEDLLAAGWTGDAATAFRPLFDDWAAAAGGNVVELRRLVEALRATTSDVVATEQAHEDVSKSLGAALPGGSIQQLMEGR